MKVLITKKGVSIMGATSEKIIKINAKTFLVSCIFVLYLLREAAPKKILRGGKCPPQPQEVEEGGRVETHLPEEGRRAQPRCVVMSAILQVSNIIFIASISILYFFVPHHRSHPAN
jgi:hypothetical protein